MNRVVHSAFGPLAKQSIHSFHPEVVSEVQDTVQQQAVVVVGMFLNPYVIFVRYLLRKANIPYTYLQYGGYLSRWKARLAIKMWSGWPTFPQVFVNGTLIGGSSCTRQALQDGSFNNLLSQQGSPPQ